MTLFNEPDRERDGLRRGGFTLIELLIVIGIIAALAALIAAATAQLMQGQLRSASELAVQRTKAQLDSSYRDVNDKLRDEAANPPPVNVINLAGGDPRRSLVIWRKLRFKQEFPQSYAEAVYPWAVNNNPQNAVQYLAWQDLPPKDGYVQALKRVGLLPANWTFTSPVPANFGLFPDDEMAACLLLSLTVNRRGTNFDAEQALGPGALKDTNGDGLKKIVDAWGHPLGFYRWPWGNPDIAASVSAQVTDRDPEDPELLLMDANWNNATSYAAQGPVFKFEVLCHPVHAGSYAPISYYMVPTVVSAGPNQRFGLALGSMTPLGPDANDNINGYMSQSLVH